MQPVALEKFTTSKHGEFCLLCFNWTIEMHSKLMHNNRPHPLNPFKLPLQKISLLAHCFSPKTLASESICLPLSTVSSTKWLRFASCDVHYHCIPLLMCCEAVGTPQPIPCSASSASLNCSFVTCLLSPTLPQEHRMSSQGHNPINLHLKPTYDVIPTNYAALAQQLVHCEPLLSMPRVTVLLSPYAMVCTTPSAPLFLKP